MHHMPTKEAAAMYTIVEAATRAFGAQFSDIEIPELLTCRDPSEQVM
jgi:hypothetical protein